ncbi:helix-turn-helix domain-containing protein [Psychromonas ossibalaenae]|uniref:helix-turn-helix domain-containing protein n=1 Tax=Psychromonas ossibalaenae TaxID=444922 RepID=UPI00036D17FB|nr:AraC family transcriptional regulator [Psychromonas ossibalaenae]
MIKADAVQALRPKEQHDDEIFVLVNNVINNDQSVKRIYAAGKNCDVPELAWQINNPRLDIVISGSIVSRYGTSDGCSMERHLRAGDVLYVPASAWSLPVWQDEVTILSFIFSSHKIGVSLQQWNGQKFSSLKKKTVIRQHERIGNGLLQALNELCAQEADHHTPALVIRSLISHISMMGEASECRPNRQKELFQRIVDYIDNNFSVALSREMISEKFYISPNYMSHLFQQQGNISFKDYLCAQRLTKARELLLNNNNRIKHISDSCGFSGSNYFCRLFKQKTGLTPSQYRSSAAAVNMTNTHSMNEDLYTQNQQH